MHPLGFNTSLTGTQGSDFHRGGNKQTQSKTFPSLTHVGKVTLPKRQPSNFFASFSDSRSTGLGDLAIDEPGAKDADALRKQGARYDPCSLAERRNPWATGLTWRASVPGRGLAKQGPAAVFFPGHARSDRGTALASEAGASTKHEAMWSVLRWEPANKDGPQRKKIRKMHAGRGVGRKQSGSSAALFSGPISILPPKFTPFGPRAFA